jgi:hypothetical protein
MNCRHTSNPFLKIGQCNQTTVPKLNKGYRSQSVQTPVTNSFLLDSFVMVDSSSSVTSLPFLYYSAHVHMTRGKLLIQITEFYPLSCELPCTNVPTNIDISLIAEASFADLVQVIFTVWSS